MIHAIRFMLLPVVLLCCLAGRAGETELRLSLENYHRYDTAGLQKATPAEKAGINALREQYRAKPHRKSFPEAKQWSEALSSIDAEGRIGKVAKLEEKWEAGTLGNPGELTAPAFSYLQGIAEAVRTGEIPASKALTPAYWKAVIRYGEIELGRPFFKTGRFHSSCFALPVSAVGIYFCLLPVMDKVESGADKNPLRVYACEILKSVALQAWTQPYRKDSTDNNVVSVERFRGHVWWVGGNGTSYRPLLGAAAMLRSVPMMEVLSEVCSRGISMTSQVTYDESFWIEGFTADGAGWGHGKQCLVWGYPIHGTLGSMTILQQFRSTPWERDLTVQNIETLFNFLRGSNWYYYKGYIIPCVDRFSMDYAGKKSIIPSRGMSMPMARDWKEAFTAEQLAELKQFTDEANKFQVDMQGYPEGMYGGTRWFFNNGDLIKKNERYHLIVNTAPLRCDGLETAIDVADRYNFFTNAGLTLFQREGDEYRSVYGGWDVTLSPGVTTREGMDRITPVTNWRGYCSKHDFAAGATRGGANAVGGFIWECMNASQKEGVNDRGDIGAQNEVLYGVKAYKSWFVLGDYTVALGAGITNLTPQVAGAIRTSIDQTALVAPVSIVQGKKSTVVANGTHAFPADGMQAWVAQKGKFAYTVLPEYAAAARFSLETRPADWARMNAANKSKKDLPKSVDVLSLWIDHGAKPEGASYGYAVYAGDGLPAAKLPFMVMRNDVQVQAVRMSDNSVLGAVFYDPAVTLSEGKTSLSVSAPCAVLVEKTGREWTLTVTDAMMNPELKQITVRFNGQTVAVPMPAGELCGKPSTVRLK